MTSTRLLPREGFYLDTLLDFFWLVIKNPLFSLPITAIILLPPERYVPYVPFELTNIRVIIYSTLTIFGLLARANAQFSRTIKNNGVSDELWLNQNWCREVILITGASNKGGIGHSTIKHLFSSRTVDKCPRVAILDIKAPDWLEDNDTTERAITSSKRKLIHYFHADLSDLPSVPKVYSQVTTKFKTSPTILIHCAGLGRAEPLYSPKTTSQSITTSINVMLTAPMILTNLILPSMVSRNHGHILSLSSFSAYIAPPGIADYAAAKNGLVSMHECLNLELRKIAPAIRLSIFNPSFIRTPLLRGVAFNQSRLDRFIAPILNVESVGERIAEILNKGEGEDVLVPRVLLGWISGIRGWSSWAAHLLRRGSEKVPFEEYAETLEKEK